MGFDLTGERARTEKGEYFRNNCWWWRPLWDYVCQTCSNLLSNDDYERGSYNDGHFIGPNKTIRIGIRLEHLVNQGDVAKYEKKYKKRLKNMPLEKCELCHGTGHRNDEHVVGKCNGCDGKGEKESWETNYPFTADNVKEFALFCRESGGFRIW